MKPSRLKCAQIRSICRVDLSEGLCWHAKQLLRVHPLNLDDNGGRQHGSHTDNKRFHAFGIRQIPALFLPSSSFGRCMRRDIEINP